EGPTEMRRLSEAFEEMRRKLYSARQELQQWNLKLEERVAQRTHELETLNEVSREIASRLDTQQVLNSVTDKARALLGGEIASLCLVDENRHWLKLQAVSGPKQAVIGDTMPTGSQFTLAVLNNEQAMICGVDSCNGGCRMLSEEYRTSHLTAPLKIGNRVIGALCVGSPAQNQFAEESVGMLTKLANVAAIALENARLFAQAEKVATLEERHRVAAEMHDGLGQTLSYLGLMTDQVVEFLSGGKEGEALERLNKTRETITHATSEVRRAINSLMEQDLAQKDLTSRLKELLDETASKHDLQAVCQVDADSPLNLSEQTAEQVYKIAREALINITRHANAHKILMLITKQNNQYTLTIEDDGQGFDISQPKPAGHFGLQVMQARAKQINGSLKINSQKGHGSQVTLTWTQPIEA
ncbi:MAG: GAF domain-containing protein, partial [Anaerolineales bacterium]